MGYEGCGWRDTGERICIERVRAREGRERGGGGEGTHMKKYHKSDKGNVMGMDEGAGKTEWGVG